MVAVTLVSVILQILGEFGKLLSEVVAAEAAGKPLRVEDVLPTELQTTIAKGVADARARVRYGE